MSFDRISSGTLRRSGGDRACRLPVAARRQARGWVPHRAVRSLKGERKGGDGELLDRRALLGHASLNEPPFEFGQLGLEQPFIAADVAAVAAQQGQLFINPHRNLSRASVA